MMRRPRRAGAAAAAAAAPAIVGVAVAVLAGDGAIGVRAAALAEGGVAASAVLVGVFGVAGLLRLPRLSPPAIIAVVSLSMYSVLAYASADWSYSPSASRQDAFRAGACALAVVVGALGATSQQARRVAMTLVAALAAASCAAAVIDRSVSTTTPDLTARLAGALGHPNSLAVMAVVVVVTGLVMVPRYPFAAAALAALGVVVLIASSSRAGVATAVVAVAVVTWRGQGSLGDRLIAACALLPAVTIGIWLASWTAFSSQTGTGQRLGAGLILATLAAMTASALAAWAGLRARLGRRLGERRLLAAVATTIGVITASVVAVGVSQPNQGVLGHLVATYSSDRGRWWSIAWDAFLREPWRGFGAGAFRIIASLAGESGIVPTSAHNALLDGLAGTGVLGGGLIAAALVGLGWAAVAGARDPAGLVAAALVVAWLVHALVDVGWQATPLAVLAGLAVGAAGATRMPLPRLVCLLVAVAGAALLVAAPMPWLAQRALDRATTATDPVMMLAFAKDAVRWEPDNVQALIVQAEADQSLGRAADSMAAFARAIRAEPENFQPWELLGVYQLRYWHRPSQALNSLTRAYALSGHSAFIQPDLDAARRAVYG